MGFFILGIFNTQRVNSAIYTHTLNYTNSDHGHSLTGRVSFDDSNLISSNYPDGVFSFGSGNFITNITFTYTNNTTNQVFTLSITLSIDRICCLINSKVLLKDYFSRG